MVYCRKEKITRKNKLQIYTSIVKVRSHMERQHEKKKHKFGIRIYVDGNEFFEDISEILTIRKK